MAFKPLSCIYGNFVIPQRYVMAVMVQLGLINAYHLRVVLNIAINEMIEPVNSTTIGNSCPQFVYEKVENVGGGTYAWPSWLRAIILYAFYFSYFASHLPGGWLADKLGARHVMGTCMMVGTVATLVFPSALKAGGHKAAIAVRAILGFSQGPMYPVASSFIQKWAPYEERAFIGSIALSGGSFGTFTGNLFTGLIIHTTKSWTVAFYIWAALAIIWYIFYLFMVFSRPTTHPFITPKELELLKDLKPRKKFSVPWKRLLTCRPIWGILFSQLAHDFTYFLMVTDLPKYMKDVLKFNIKRNATYSALPFLMLGVANILFARLSDYIMNRGWCETVVLRKIYSVCGNILPGLCLIIASYVGCSRLATIILTTIGMGLMSPYYSGTMININDLTRNYSGIIMAFISGLGSFNGILAPWLVGYFTPNGTLEEWRKIFWIVFVFTTLNSSVYVMLAKVERQDWDYPEQEDKLEENKPEGSKPEEN